MTKRPYLSEALKASTRQKSKHRCGYCLAPQDLVYQVLHVDHVLPVSKGGSSDEDNLWACCDVCNGYKSNKVVGIDHQTNEVVSLFNPITQIWTEHFNFGEDAATIIGITPIGRATVDILKLNDAHRLKVRLAWVEYGRYPPKD